MRLELRYEQDSRAVILANTAFTASSDRQAAGGLVAVDLGVDSEGLVRVVVGPLSEEESACSIASATGALELADGRLYLLNGLQGRVGDDLTRTVEVPAGAYRVTLHVLAGPGATAEFVPQAFPGDLLGRLRAGSWPCSWTRPRSWAPARPTACAAATWRRPASWPPTPGRRTPGWS